MNNNYNPYTVPENFFGDTEKRAVTRFRNRRRVIQYSVAAMMVASALIITPLFVHLHECRVQKTEVVSNNLAGMYEYDIFLQVNFTK